MATKISWAEDSWNPLTGCKKVSPGCRHCYASWQHNRMHANFPHLYGPKFEDVSFNLDHLSKGNDPLHWKTPKIVFVCSMSDLFYEKHTSKQIEAVLKHIEKTQWHRYVVLTKRPERMRDFFKNCPIPSNVWLGVTCEDRKHGIPRVEILKTIGTGIKCVSMEPLLEDLGDTRLKGIDWIMVGGERVCNGRQGSTTALKPAWVRKLLRVARKDGVAFHFKQWGSQHPDPDIGWTRNVVKENPPLDGKVYAEFPNDPSFGGRLTMGKHASKQALPQNVVPMKWKEPTDHFNVRMPAQHLDTGPLRQLANALIRVSDWVREHADRLDDDNNTVVVHEVPISERRPTPGRRVGSPRFESYAELDAAIARGEVKPGSEAAYRANVTRYLKTQRG